MTELNPHMVVTRKPHICFGCARKFPAGMKMQRSCVVDGGLWTCYLCEKCLEVMSEMESGDEFGFGDLREDGMK